MKIRSIGLVAGLLALAACTAEPDARTAAAGPPAAEPLGTCFWPHEITGYGGAGANGLYVRTGAGKRYLVETLGPCPPLDFSLQVGLRNRSGGAICGPAGVEVVIPDPSGTRICPVASIREVPREGRSAD